MQIYLLSRPVSRSQASRWGALLPLSIAVLLFLAVFARIAVTGLAWNEEATASNVWRASKQIPIHETGARLARYKNLGLEITNEFWENARVQKFYNSVSEPYEAAKKNGFRDWKEYRYPLVLEWAKNGSNQNPIPASPKDIESPTRENYEKWHKNAARHQQYLAWKRGEAEFPESQGNSRPGLMAKISYPLLPLLNAAYLTVLLLSGWFARRWLILSKNTLIGRGASYLLRPRNLIPLALVFLAAGGSIWSSMTGRIYLATGVSGEKVIDFFYFNAIIAWSLVLGLLAFAWIKPGSAYLRRDIA